ncbi:MAG: hypothetical protein AAB874_05590 [Patescibacteria group bacterium]
MAHVPPKLLVELDPPIRETLAYLTERLDTSVGAVLSEALAMFKNAQGKKVILKDKNGQLVEYDYTYKGPARRK